MLVTQLCKRLGQTCWGNDLDQQASYLRRSSIGLPGSSDFSCDLQSRVQSWGLPILPVSLFHASQCLLASLASDPSLENVLINDENCSALQACKGFLGALCRKKFWLLLSTVPVTPVITVSWSPGSFLFSWVCLPQRHSEHYITVAWCSSVHRSIQAWNPSETQGIRCVKKRGRAM